MGVLPANGARGEVPLRIGSIDLVIAAEIGRLAQVSTELECKSFVDLYERLMRVEIAATVAGIRCMTVRGDAASAIEALKLSDFPAVKDAFTTALLHHHADDEGKDDAAQKGEQAAMMSRSPSVPG